MSITQPQISSHHASPPDELARRRRWVCWAYDRHGKKPPVDPRTGKAASTADSQTWGTYEAAAAAAEEHGYTGLGFVLTAEDPYAVIDLDGVVDPDTGEIELWAAEMVNRFDSYAELSPSGTGLHIWVRGSIEGTNKASSSPIEIMCAGSYLTITGRVFHDSAIADRSDELRDIHAAITDTGQSDAGCTGIQEPNALPDDEVLERARANRVTGQRFRALYDRGDVPYRNPDTGFPDHSRAHFELLRMLAFWTGRNAKQMERLFSKSAHGQHEKWTERPDYRTRTIRAAIKRTRKTYQLGRPKPNATALKKMWAMDQAAAHAPWTGKNGSRNRYALDAMISTGVEQGKDHPAGVTLQASIGYLALRAGISSSRRMLDAIEDLEREGWIVRGGSQQVRVRSLSVAAALQNGFDNRYPPCVNTVIKLRSLLRRIRDNGRLTGGGEYVAKGRDRSRIARSPGMCVNEK